MTQGNHQEFAGDHHHREGLSDRFIFLPPTIPVLNRVSSTVVQKSDFWGNNVRPAIISPYRQRIFPSTRYVVQISSYAHCEACVRATSILDFTDEGMGELGHRATLADVFGFLRMDPPNTSTRQAKSFCTPFVEGIETCKYV